MQSKFVKEALKPWLLASVSAFVLHAGASAVAYSEEAAEVETYESSDMVEELVVTGQRSSRANQSLTPDVIETVPMATDIMNVVNRLPGVNVQQPDAFGGDDWQTQITVRGFGNRQLGYVVDGVPNGDSGYGGGAKPNRFVDIENLSSVNVSQGSADVGSPSNQALGGTLAYFSSDPNDESGFRVSQSAGDNNLRRTFLRYDTGSIMGSEDTKAYFSVSDTFYNRWIGTGSNGHLDRFHVEGKMVHQFAGGSSVKLRASFNNRKEDDYNNVSLEQWQSNKEWDGLTWFWTGDPSVDQNFAETWSGHRRDRLISAETDIVLSDSMNLLVTPYYHAQGGEGFWMPPYVVITDDGSLTGNYVERQYTDPDTGEYTASRRLSHYANKRMGATYSLTKEFGMHSLRVGGWFENQDRDNWRMWYHILDEASGYEYDYNPYWLNFDRNFDSKTTMVYAQDNVSMMDDRLRLDLGAAWHKVSTDYTDLMSGETDVQDSSSGLMPKIGALFVANDNLEFFGNFSENFSALDDGLLTSEETTANLNPEESTNIDLGVRFNTGRFSMSAAFYNVKFRNRISYEYLDAADVDLYLAPNGWRYVNVGGIESKGLEMAASFDISNELSLYASYSYNDSTYAEDNPAEGIVAGKQVVSSPKNMFFTEVTYETEQFRIGLDAKYTDTRFGTVENDEEAPSYWLANLSGAYYVPMNSEYIEALEVGFNVYNLFNARYLSGVFGGGSYSPGAPRSFMVTATARF